MSNDCVNNHKSNSNTNKKKGDQITNKTSSVNSVDQLLPILLYIRNFNEYDRHKPVIKWLINLLNFNSLTFMFRCNADKERMFN